MLRDELGSLRGHVTTLLADQIDCVDEVEERLQLPLGRAQGEQAAAMRTACVLRVYCVLPLGRAHGEQAAAMRTACVPRV